MGHTGGCRRPVNFLFGAINLMDCKTAHHFLSPSLGWAGLGWAVRLAKNMPKKGLPGVPHSLLGLLPLGTGAGHVLFLPPLWYKGEHTVGAFRESCRAGTYLIGTFPGGCKGWGGAELMVAAPIYRWVSCWGVCEVTCPRSLSSRVIAGTPARFLHS